MGLKDSPIIAGSSVVRQLGRGGMASINSASQSGFARQAAREMLGENHAAEPNIVARYPQDPHSITSVEHGALAQSER